MLLASLPATAAAAAGAALDWGGCAGDDLDPRQQCATLDVPLDNDDPRGEHIELAPSRRGRPTRATPVACRRPEQVCPLFLDLAARLDAEPIPWPGANPPELSGNTLRQTLLDALYAPGRYPRLTELMRAAVRTARPCPRRTPRPTRSCRTPRPLVATICNDVAWPTDLDTYVRGVAASRESHQLTAGMPVNVVPCAFWPRPAEPLLTGHRARPPTPSAPRNPTMRPTGGR